MISQPEPERYLFAVGSRAGYLVFLFVHGFLSKLFCFMSVSFCLCFCFRLVYLSFCIYNRTNPYNNRKHITRNSRKTQSKLNKLFCLNSVVPCLFLVSSSKSYHICFIQVKTITTTTHIKQQYFHL